MEQANDHWRLTADPFASGSGCFVPIPSHVEAIARVVHAIKSREPRVQVRAPAGLGKTVVLNRVLAAVRSPDLCIARGIAADSDRWLDDLARALGARSPAEFDRPAAWKRLAEAAKLRRIQGQGVVFAIDDRHELDDGIAPEMDRLARSIDPHPGARVTVLEFGRPTSRQSSQEPWILKVRLAPLTRTETTLYIDAKLAAAGRMDPTFTPRAINKLHALSAGNPRGIDRLAGLALLAGAMKRLEILPPDVIDGVAEECVLPESA